ncbi:MAG: sulfurtransferase TusA family protein [Myxococcales bacterium]|nr:sulfurtransferase TusA family protein [Myxococcales bacterium]
MTKSSPSSSPPTSSSPGDPEPAAAVADAAPDTVVLPGALDAVLADSTASSASDERRSLDLTGELCPFTFVRTKLALEALPLGAELRVIVDHEPAIRNLPRSATEWGQEILAVTVLSPTTWAIDLRKRVR